MALSTATSGRYWSKQEQWRNLQRRPDAIITAPPSASTLCVMERVEFECRVSGIDKTWADKTWVCPGGQGDKTTTTMILKSNNARL